jgi:hypothetical protein
MKIYIHNKDILDVTEADTIILPVDGSAPGLEGNIARKFLKRVGFDEMHELYAPPPYYPFNGSGHWSSIQGLETTHFNWICALGVLSHEQGVDHKAIARSALSKAFTSADLSMMGTRLACPVLSAGWRNDPVSALYMMLMEAERFGGSRLELHIAELDKDRYDTFKSIVG